ncbi:MAG TPA: TonB family protein [Holophagaceae bacterium]|nr:TonB family protein [Holophagaceae bacterium]
MILVPALVIQSHETPAPLSPKDFQAKCGEFSKAKDWKGLEGLARTQIAANPKDAPAEAALGFALLAQDRTADAKAACERAIALNRREVTAYLYLGLICAQSGDRDGVIKTGQRLSEADPFGVKGYYQAPPLAAATGTDPKEVFVKEAKAIPSHGWPLYPDSAREMKIQGTVVYNLHVGADGLPTSVEVLAGPPQLATPSILDFAKGTRFEPVLKDGHPIAFRTILSYSFRLGAPAESIF